MIVINLDIMMAKRKISSGELAERVGITQANLSILKTNKARAIRFSTLEKLCEVLHVSKNKLYSAFASQCGTTVNAYITQQRLERAKQLLWETDEPVYRVAEAIGIRNYTYFCRLFKKKTGLSPLAYRRSGKK